MVKAMDLRSCGGSACRFDSWHRLFFRSYFFYDDDGATRAAAQASVKLKR